MVRQGNTSSLIEKPDDVTWLGVIFLIAAITGAVGGCAGAAHIFLSKDKPVKVIQVLAYSMIGAFLGIMSFGILALSSYFGLVEVHTVEAMIGFSAIFGFFGSLFLSGTNIIIRWTTKRLGSWEIDFTARQDNQDRRGKRKK